MHIPMEIYYTGADSGYSEGEVRLTVVGAVHLRRSAQSAEIFLPTRFSAITKHSCSISVDFYLAAFTNLLYGLKN